MNIIRAVDRERITVITKKNIKFDNKYNSQNWSIIIREKKKLHFVLLSLVF